MVKNDLMTIANPGQLLYQLSYTATLLVLSLVFSLLLDGLSRIDEAVISKWLT